MVEYGQDSIKSQAEDQENFLEARDRLIELSIPQRLSACSLAVIHQDELFPDLFVGDTHTFFGDIKFHCPHAVIRCDRGRHQVVDLADDLDGDVIRQHFDDVLSVDTNEEVTVKAHEATKHFEEPKHHRVLKPLARK